MNTDILRVPAGRLALDPAKLKRKKIADDLKNGNPLHIGASGHARVGGLAHDEESDFHLEGIFSKRVDE